MKNYTTQQLTALMAILNTAQTAKEMVRGAGQNWEFTDVNFWKDQLIDELSDRAKQGEVVLFI